MLRVMCDSCDISRGEGGAYHCHVHIIHVKLQHRRISSGAGRHAAKRGDKSCQKMGQGCSAPSRATQEGRVLARDPRHFCAPVRCFESNGNWACVDLCKRFASDIDCESKPLAEELHRAAHHGERGGEHQIQGAACAHAHQRAAATIRKPQSTLGSLAAAIFTAARRATGS
jgi:hypothetical protein